MQASTLWIVLFNKSVACRSFLIYILELISYLISPSFFSLMFIINSLSLWEGLVGLFLKKRRLRAARSHPNKQSLPLSSLIKEKTRESIKHKKRKLKDLRNKVNKERIRVELKEWVDWSWLESKYITIHRGKWNSLNFIRAGNQPFHQLPFNSTKYS